MSSPSITNNNGVTFTFNDGDIERVSINLNTDIDYNPMPGSYPSDSMMFNVEGCTKIIEVSGALTLATTTRTNSGVTLTIDDQRKWLEIIFSGNQNGSIFKSTYSSTYNGSSWVDSKILLATFRHDEMTGTPNALPFTLTLYVGDA